MVKPKQITKKIVKQFCKTQTHWSINESQTILSGEFSASDYIAGLILLSKIIVIAHVAGVTPTYTLRKNSLLIKFSGTVKTPLSMSQLQFAEKISTTFLSTKESRFKL